MALNNFYFVVRFVALYIVLVLLQLSLNRKYKSKIILSFIFAFSYFFIATSDWRFCLCVLTVTVISYLLALRIEKTTEKKRKLWFIGGVLLHIIFLGYFKYTNFFINSFRKIIGHDSITLNIILPIGISFYVFSAMSYLIDVYRGYMKAEKNILYYALYVSFFPKLTAGPIERAKNFLSQIRDYHGLTVTNFQTGIQIFVFGLFKKIVLADHLGVFVDDVFYTPTAFNTGTVILGAISYSLQIFFDFSGYSDIAVGVSKILGFDLKPNFNLPYIAQDVSEFWKRWHISLSSWFQDYVYIPLGGSRKGTARTYINLLITMLISGLWHGAGWTFVVWGGVHGIMSCLNKAIGGKIKRLGKIISTTLTFIIVTLLWVIFRADSFSNALDVLKEMFTIHTGISQPYTWSFFAMACLAVGSITAWRRSIKNGDHDKNGNLFVNGFYPVLDLNKFWSLVVFFTFCGLTIIMGYFGNTAFIYGAF